jgi:hypothetical protein
MIGGMRMKKMLMILVVLSLLLVAGCEEGLLGAVTYNDTNDNDANETDGFVIGGEDSEMESDVESDVSDVDLKKLRILKERTPTKMASLSSPRRKATSSSSLQRLGTQMATVSP